MGMQLKSKVIAFDADDTLWVNETYYKKAEQKFCSLMREFKNEEEAFQELFNTEMKNIPLFGYGAKGFTISTIETALRISNQEVSPKIIQKLIENGKELMDYPIQILPNVEQVLEILKKRYKLIIVTKGDLKDQERKLEKSGLSKYFHHIEILSDKKKENYLQLLAKLEIDPDDFLMIGNSLRSDIQPVLKLGSYAVHIPFHDSWAHESEIEEEIESNRFIEVASISKIPELLERYFS